jgi:hypothetical protein
LRQIFIGDVQGCADELETLLDRADADFGSDWTVWLVGDLVNRGPASLRVLQRVHALWEQGRARCVLGNHDLSLIQVAWGLRALRPTDTFGDVLEAPDAEEWIDWLRKLPLVETGRLGAQDFAMLHAAVDPDWDMATLRATGDRVAARLSGSQRAARAFLAADAARDAERDALARLTSCRSVRDDGRWSPEPPDDDSQPWHLAWAARGHAYGDRCTGTGRSGGLYAAGLRGLDAGYVPAGAGATAYPHRVIPDTTRTLPFGVPTTISDECARARARTTWALLHRNETR